MGKKATEPKDGTQSKTATVQGLINGGLESPKEIVEAAKKLGVVITANYASMIKGEMKKKRMAESGNGTATTAVEKKEIPEWLLPPPGLELAALRLIIKANGVENAIAAIRDAESKI